VNSGIGTFCQGIHGNVFKHHQKRPASSWVISAGYMEVDHLAVAVGSYGKVFAGYLLPDDLAVRRAEESSIRSLRGPGPECCWWGDRTWGFQVFAGAALDMKDFPVGH
jgi:hypothetical protein